MKTEIKKSERINEAMLRNWGQTLTALFLLVLLALAPSLFSMLFGG